MAELLVKKLTVYTVFLKLGFCISLLDFRRSESMVWRGCWHHGWVSQCL